MKKILALVLSVFIAISANAADWTLTDPEGDRVLGWDDSATGAEVVWFGLGTGLAFDATPNLTIDATIAALAGLTIADVSIIEGTGADAYAVVTSGGANRFLKSNSDNSALEFAVPTLASFTGQTAWRLFYSNADGDVTELALGSDGEYLKSNGASAAPTWATPSGAAHDAVTISTDAADDILVLATQVLGLVAQNANVVLAGPATTGTGKPTFRSLVAADLPAATESAIGAIEKATTAEVVTGEDTDRAATPAGVAAAMAAPPSTGIGNTTPRPGYFTTLSATDGITASKTSGVSGKLHILEANSTDTDFAGFWGPASLTANTSYVGQFPNARPTSDNMVLVWGGTAGSGDGTPSTPYVHAMTYVDLDSYVPLSLFDAHTIIFATTDNTPAALTVGEQKIVGRVTGGNIAALDIDADLSSVSANDDTVPSAKAVKAVTDLKAPLTIARSEFIPVAWMIDGAAKPGDLATTDLGTRQVKTRSFQGDTADQDLEMLWQAPIDIIDGDAAAGFQVKWRPIFVITSATAPGSGEGVAFALQACSSGNGDTGDCTVGTASVIADADLDAHVQFDIVYGGWTEITVTDGAAAEAWMMKLYRDQDNAIDDYAQAVGLIGIEIKYKATLADSY